MPSAPSPRPSEDRPTIGAQLNQSSGSFELVLSPAILALAGLWLDRRFDTTPWLTIVMAIFGAAGATLSLYYRYRHRISELEAEAAALRAEARSVQARHRRAAEQSDDLLPRGAGR